MVIIEWIAVGVAVLFVLVLVLFVRRWLFVRAGGTIRVNLRLTTMVDGRGWSPGFARFVGDDLRWYKMFSFAVRPRRVLARYALNVTDRREPTGPELLAVPPDWIILHCVSPGGEVDIAMARTTVTGFLSWLESAPPGADIAPPRRAGLPPRR